MEVKKVVKKNDEYICDIDISVDEWKEVLQDKALMRENYRDVLLKFLSEPGHKSTCKALGDKYGVSPQSFNGTITNFAKAVQKKLNRFEVIGTDGKSSFWIIPMTGKMAGEYFEWNVRPELVKAFSELNFLERTYEMEYFNLTKENIALLKNDIGEKYSVDKEGTRVYKDTRGKLEYLGDLLSDELRMDLTNNYSEKPNKQAGQGKGFTLKEYILVGFIPTQYHDQVKNNLFIKISFDGLDSLNPRFGIVIDVNRKNRSKQDNQFDLSQYRSWSIPMNEFPTNWDDLLKLVKPEFKRFINYIDSYFQNMERMKEMKSYLELLKANKNLVLTGAPGTGKTYLAKEIAKLITGFEGDEELNDSDQYSFVQFHPSYDYTDFVEGLRPTKPDANGNIGFELKNGIFKSFCKKALRNLIDSQKSDDELKQQQSIAESLSSFIEKINNEIADSGSFNIRGIGGKLCAPIIEIDSDSFITKSKNNNTLSTPLTGILVKYDRFKKNEDIKWTFKEVGDKLGVTYHHTYFFAFLNAFNEYQKNNAAIIEEVEKVEKKDFVFIIDEINRAEISKVLGELFFSIDPGYRGEKGKVQTQYANLQDADDVFADGFFVPENVFIIATMNDIDRSVESMDFAMRRRFAWKEVKAEDRISMWNGRIDILQNDALKRMNSLNQAIEEVQGLSSAYHIGPAYFLKLRNYQNEINPFDSLWSNHLEGVIFEYLRGLPESDELMNKLKNAYDKLIDVNND